MTTLIRYRKKNNNFVIAVQLNVETEGFRYHKWGTEQRCKPGDWIVNNNEDIYTVDKSVFEKTYKQVSPGIYAKITPIWAEIATQSGDINTIEGHSHYERGDYIVYNNENRTDGYCMTAAKFQSMYELDE